MSVGTTVVAALSKIGTVHDAEKIREASSGHFFPETYPNPKGPTGARCSLYFVKDGDAPDVVNVAMRSDGGTTDVDIEPLIKLVARKNNSSEFGAINLAWRKCDDDYEYCVSVSHSLTLLGLTEDAVITVVTEMLRMWQDAVESVERHIRYTKRIARNNARRAAAIEAQKATSTEPKKVTENAGLQSVLAQIDALVGLESVKTFARQLVAQQRLAELRKEHNLDTSMAPPHLVFMGDPGTGKTTVARLIGRLYRSLGLVRTGHVVEVDRGSLVGGYIGQTALKTKEVCNRAIGGVLFIDEAYSLAGSERDYGAEALVTLLAFMENNRGKLAVVIAGYPQQMETLLDSNPGLRSRFDTTLSFANYAPQELLQMLVRQVSEEGYEFTKSALADVAYKFVQETQAGNVLNARSVRILANELVAQHAMTLMSVASPTETQIKTITSLSVPEAWGRGRKMLPGEVELVE
jgi:hypothetical protein